MIKLTLSVCVVCANMWYIIPIVTVSACTTSTINSLVILIVKMLATWKHAINS